MASLTKKLDAIFSQFIRLRDSQPFGYRAFRCISCGQVKPFDQMDCGHFISRTHMSTRFDENNCHGECRACLTPDALVLTKDLRWVPLGELQVGDKLVGFSEDSAGRAENRRRWAESEVTHVHREVRDVYDVELENGDHVKTTADHKWLVRTRNDGMEWMETQNMWINGVNIQGNHKTGPHTERTTTTVCKPFLVVQQEQSYAAGWIAGMLDADGHVCQQNIHDPDGTIRYGLRIGIAQSETYPKICSDIVKGLEEFTDNRKPCRQTMEKNKGSFRSTIRTWQFLITGTNVEKLQFLMRTRPHKIDKIDINKVGMVRSKYDTKVKSITHLGPQEIVVMETSTRTFIANGYMMHNCNRFSADHMIYYQANLVRKIGAENVELLIAKGHQSKKWTAFELEVLIRYYTERVKEMKNG